MRQRPSLITTLTLILTGLLAVAMVGTLRASSGTPRPSVIAPEVWEAAGGGAQTDVLVVLAEQADLSGAGALSIREERLRYVYNALRATALRSQPALRADLDAVGVEYRPFYVANVIAVRGGRDLLTWLAARPEVGQIVANPQVRQHLPELRGDALLQATEGVEWNVRRLNADQVWDLGYRGERIVVAGQDTGYDWDHPALIKQYRGRNGFTTTHDYNWHDAIHEDDLNNPNNPPGNACGFDAAEPCDDDGHGTHTMGTIVGDDGNGRHIGVAPGAEWIGCRNMEQGWGTPATYMECFEFFLAPYPVGGDPFSDGDPSKAPHVINNSWTCPPVEGCHVGTLQTVVENVRAAGIMVVASAGNGGSACGTVVDPPAIYDAAFSVGATTSDDTIAVFSSRGPVTADGSLRLKPDVSAPGQAVRSSVPGGFYASLNGTSMAGPHVAGTAALVWSAAPWLIGDINATEDVIRRSARARTTTQGCGDDDADDAPNHVYGWGIVDALAALDYAWVPVSGQAAIPGGLLETSVRYSLTVTNRAPFSMTGLTLSNTLPVSTTLSWADDGFEYDGRTVSWVLPLLPPEAVLSRSLVVALTNVSPGTSIVNDRYGLKADQLSGTVFGVPTEVVIPWRILMFPVFKGAAIGGSEGG